MANDICNTVLDRLIVDLPKHYNGDPPSLPANDPLYLRTVVKSPLQDDPTLRAFYLTVGPDENMTDDDTHWRMPTTSVRRGKLGLGVIMPEIEIGGGYLFINFFRAEGWLPICGNREIAHEIGGKAQRYLERAFSRFANGLLYQGLSTDDGYESTLGNFVHVFGNDGSHYKITGGDNEWYPQISMRFHVFSRVEPEYFAP